MRLKISVTEEDIAKGKRDNEAWCPIARAIRREFPSVLRKRVTNPKNAKLESVAVDADYVHICTPVGCYNASASSKMTKFIETFDEKGKTAVKPGNFTINLTEDRYDED